MIFTANATASMKLVAENFQWNNKNSDNSNSNNSHSSNNSSSNNGNQSSSSAFVYVDECHTSAVGLRQIAAASGAKIIPVSAADFKSVVTTEAGTFPGPNLAVFPAMSNFCGKKFPVEDWIEVSRRSGFRVLLDAAAFVSTSPLDLGRISPDFVAISFYKIFGYPTGATDDNI